MSGKTADRSSQLAGQVGRRVRLRGRRRVPLVQQMQAADCGAASLAMALAYFGRYEPLDELRAHMSVGRDGVSAKAIADAAERYGLRCRPLRVELDAVRALPAATILHWDMGHFVVLEGVSRRGVHIVDPARGRRLVSWERFDKSFTGVALALEPTADFSARARTGGSLWTIWKRAMVRPAFVWQVLIASLLIQLVGLVVPMLTGVLVDSVLPHGDVSLLWLLSGSVVAIAVVYLLTSLVRGYRLLELRVHIETNLTLGFMEHMVALPLTFFQLRPSGDLMHRVDSHQEIRDILTDATLSGLLDGAFVLVSIAVLALLAPSLGAVTLALVVLQLALFVLTRRRSRELMVEEIEAASKNRSFLVQIFSGIETLKSAGSERRALQHWSNLWVDELNASLERGRLSLVVNAASQTLRAISPAAVLLLGAWLVLDGQLSIGTMLAGNVIALNALTPLAGIVGNLLRLELLRGHIERIEDVVEAEPEMTDPDERQPVGSLRGRVEIDGVSYRYARQAPWVVREVSGAIEPGSLIAVVGASGSGKSTLAKLIAGLYVPEAGRVLFDHRPIERLHLGELRSALGIVPQSAYLFSGTVAQNLRMNAPSAHASDIEKAARAACIHDVITRMPLGYQTPLTEGGMSLAGGQRQRIALARALVANPAILVLDEATSAIDSATEAQVLANLEKLGCTRVLITHRLLSVRNADEIWVMDEGRLVERGGFAELCRPGTLFSRLLASWEGGDA